MDSYQLLNAKRMNSQKKKAKNNSLQYYFAVMLQGTLWNNFLGDQSDARPLGDAVLDRWH